MFLFLSFLFLALRLHVRLQIIRFPWWDDVLIVTAAIFSAIEWAILVASTHKGLGQHIQHFDQNELPTLLRLNVFANLFWCWAVTCIKISIALTLLRIKTEGRWRVGLGLAIAVQVVAALVNTLVSLLQCRPLAAAWDPALPGAKCTSPNAQQIMAYCLSAIYIGSDILFALLPLTFIYMIQRSLREKIILAILMSLGLVASGAAIAKVVTLSRLPTATDPTWAGADAFIWANLEESIGMIAACIPMLKPLFERVLERCGLAGTAGGCAARSKLTGTTGESRPATVVKSPGFWVGYRREQQASQQTFVAKGSDEAIQFQEFHESEEKIGVQNIA